MDDTQAKSLEEKLKNQLSQLEIEHAVFERMIYKNKNQHRRCSYFHYLLKVRRDLRLLRTANMTEILRICFHVVSGKGAKQKLHVLESLKLKKSDNGKANVLDRLLGALHLLSQMTEPILKAASGISILLARSFFLGFSMTFLALLARLRVLIQQILLDAVSIFNTVTSTSVKKQSVKIVQDGIEVFREFYPNDEESFTLLDCVWKTDKYVLVEKLQNRENSKATEENVTENNTSRDSLVLYQTSVSSLGEDIDSPPLVEADTIVCVNATESLPPISEPASCKTNDLLQTENSENPEDESINLVSPAKTNTETIKQSCRATKVAFLPVKRPSCAITRNAMEEPPMKKQETGEKDKKVKEEEDGFYNLLIRGTQKDSLF
ncbi:unnamed protein product [Cochlearia groenlandica]